LKFCQHVTKLKNIFHSEKYIENVDILDLKFIFNYNIEEYLCETYQVERIKFKAYLSKKEVEKINEEFVSNQMLFSIKKTNNIKLIFLKRLIICYYTPLFSG